MTTFLSGKVKKTPSIQADPDRYEFLDLKNAEPDLGVAAGNNYILTSDTTGNRTWVDQVNIITNNVDQAYVNALNVDADLLDGQNGIYYLDWNNTLNKPDPTVTIDLSGDITGSGNTTLTDLASGTISIVTELSNTGVVANTYGSASKVPQITVGEDGRITSISELNVAGVSSFNYNSASAILTIGTADGSSFSANLDISAFDTDDLSEGSTNQYFTIQRANNAIDNRVTKSFVDALNINADQLDGQDGAYYVNFNNFTNLPDPKIDVIISGDVSGSANTILTNLGNGLLEITAVVADDSHNHIIANVDGLQDILDGKLDASANAILQELLTVDGTDSGLDADLLDGQHGSYYLNFNNFTNLPDPVIEASLSGDVTGTGTVTLTDLASGNLSITTVVTDDSHNHTVSTITDFNTSVSSIISSTVNKTFVDALNVDADTLDNQDGSYYLNFNNFTNLPDPNIEVTLSGDVTGAANTTLTNLGNGSISITTAVADNSHNHTIENITGLQEALDSAGITANTVLSLLLTVDGSGSGVDADLLDGQEGSYYLDWPNITNKPDPVIDITLTGDVTGTGTVTLTDLASGNVSITTTVADDSHNHTISNVDGLQTALDSKVDKTTTISTGSGLTGGGDLSTNRTISHADTSSQANTNNTNGNVVQNVEIDTFGHVTSLSSVNLDTRYVNTTGDTLTGFLTLHADPTNALHAATKEYVDTIASASLHYHDPVRVESPVDLSASYNNGTSGVGATLTGANEVLVIDGVTVSLNDRVLLYQQANTAHNGVYEVTQLGVSGTTPWIITRTTDADSYGPSDPTALGTGDAFFVQEGNTGAGELYVMTTEGTITFGTTGITFSQISSSQIYSAGSGLELNGTVFSHANTSSQTDVGPLTGGNVVSAIDLDNFGHVASLSTRTLTLSDLGFTGDPASDNYVNWNLLVDGVQKDQVTAGENVNFVGGSNITLTYSAANNTITFNGATTLASDATITLSAGSGLSGGGDFTTDQSVNETITFSHADTSTQSSVNNSGGTVIQDVTLDTYGHVTALGSKTLTTTDISEGTNEYFTVLKANNAIDARVTQSFVNALNVDADTLDSQDGSYYLDWTNTTNKPDPNIQVVLTGDITGSGNTTLTDLASGTISIATSLSGGIGSGIDADRLDGQEGTYYLDYNNFTNTPTIGNATVTISAGAGLTTGGSFTTNQTTNSTITIAHADTSSQANTNNTTGTVIQNVEIDTYGHVTSLSSTSLTTTVIGEGTNQYYTLARANTAIDNRVTQSFVNALNVDADTLDGIQGSSFLRSDATDTATGTLTFSGTVNLDGLVEIDSTYIIGADSATTSSTSAAVISSFATATYSSGKFVIQASDSVSGEVHVTELLVVHNGVTASAVEYGTIFTGSAVLATYDVDISTGNVRILATPASSNSTTFKVTESLITG